MGVSTKGIILTEEKDFWTVSQRIGHAIHNLTVEGWRAATLEERAKGTAANTLPKLDVRGNFHSPDTESCGSFWIYFRYQGEDRRLFISTDCDCDLWNTFGDDAKGIIMSMGHWGSSVELMEAILAQLTDMGECFIDESDCDEEGYRAIQKVAA